MCFFHLGHSGSELLTFLNGRMRFFSTENTTTFLINVVFLDSIIPFNTHRKSLINRKPQKKNKVVVYMRYQKLF